MSSGRVDTGTGSMNRKLRSFLRRRGASQEEIARAERDGRLLLLAFDYQLMPGRPRYTFADACARAGFDVKIARRLWRGLGFPEPPANERLFRDDDVEAIITLRHQIESTIVPVGDDYENLVQIVRVVAGSLAKIAEVESDALAGAVRARRQAGVPDDEIATEVTQSLDWSRLSRLIDYALRLQLRASTRRKLTAADPETVGAEDLAVGFVDLVGYTALSQELDPEHLAALVTRFEELAYDTVAEHGGRVVKTIGDEVMFVAGDISSAARIALRLTERSAVDELLPDARSGLAAGSVLAQEGDYYGPVVNLASRLVELARPGTVLASADVRDALADDPTFVWHRLRSRRIRDIGRVEVWALEHARQEVTEPESS
jgi:adenylate cyclase